MVACPRRARQLLIALAVLGGAAPALAGDSGDASIGDRSGGPGSAVDRSGSNWSGGAALASDKVFRGVSQTSGRPSLLLDLGYRTDTGWSAGLGIANLSRGAEVTASIAHAWQLDGDWSVQLGAAYYAYPRSNQVALYDYGEFYAALGWRGRGFGSIAVSPHTARFDVATDELRAGPTATYEISWREPLATLAGTPLALNAGIGYYDLRRINAAGGYRYASVGLAASFAAVQAHLTYVTSRAAQRDLASRADAGERWVATLLWSF